MRLCILVLITLLSGCQLMNEIKREDELANPKGIEGSLPMEVKGMSSFPLHNYTLNLANQLYKGEAGRLRNSNIAVMSFTLATELGQKTAAQQSSGLSQQIQESLITQMTQLGYSMVEHRISDSITVSEHHEDMLTRNLSNLRTRQNIDYVILGTITRQEHANMINARLVNVLNGQVISAAFTEVPINVMWTDEKIQMRNNKLYRAEY
ncbi:FlgO family outer membrane protein [Pseudoalteromonas phenolica]|uniref:FlgO family outer membrane protein n=1 Tax=Pseudoalteromonas phenolica TaxID=161398 RepID=UPI0038515991